MDLSEWIAFRNPRVATYAQYTLRDNDFWQSGLRFANGRAKRKVYDAFRMPLFVRSLGGNRVEVFGGLRSGLGRQRPSRVQGPGRSLPFARLRRGQPSRLLPPHLPRDECRPSHVQGDARRALPHQASHPLKGESRPASR